VSIKRGYFQIGNQETGAQSMPSLLPLDELRCIAATMKGCSCGEAGYASADDQDTCLRHIDDRNAIAVGIIILPLATCQARATLLCWRVISA
jgi:hypothetical protein